MHKIRQFLLCGGLAAMLVAAPLAPAAPAFSAGSLACDATTTSSMGNVVSFSGLPRTLEAGKDLVVQAVIDCPGSTQAVLKGMNLYFLNDQGIRTQLAPRKAELTSTVGTVKTYRVAVPTSGGALPEGRQVLIHRSMVMELAPKNPTGSRQPLYLSNSRAYSPEQLNLPADVQMTVGHPTHAAPHPQLPWALLAGVKAEIRMPAWGAGAVLAYRWESKDGTLLASQRDYVPSPGMKEPVRVVVTGTWPDGTIHERSSDLTSVNDDFGGFVDVTLSGKAIPYDGSVTASKNNLEDRNGSGWFRVDSSGSLSREPVTRSKTLTPWADDVGQRFQYVVGSRSVGASGIITVTAAPPPGDRRSGYVHDNVLVDSTTQLTEHLQPGYRLTADNPWPYGTSTYRWFRDGVVVPGATGAGYKLALSDVGHVLQGAVATGAKGYTSNEVRTAAVRIPLAKLQAATPRLKGAARVGTQLQATAPGWTLGTAFSYEWLRNGKVLPGFAKSTYTIQPRDHGDVINVRVTGKKAGHTTLARTAQPTVPINYGRLETAAPKISGTPRAGKTLKVHPGAWSKGTRFDYKWYRNGKRIRGANHATLRLGSSDRGKKITVLVSGGKPGYMGQSRTAAAVLVKR